MIPLQLFDPASSTYTYILHDPATRDALIIDPVDEQLDRELAVRTRQHLLRDAEAPGTSILPCHFPGMQAARLVPATGERRWVLG